MSVITDTLRHLNLALRSGLTIFYLCIIHIGVELWRLIRPPPPVSLSGKIALVTGGAGGVGRHLALELAKRGATIVLWDVNESGLIRIAQELKEEGTPIHTYVVDIGDRQSVHKYALQVISDVGPVDILINNAGIVNGKPLLQLQEEDIEKTFKVNILSHYWVSIKKSILHIYFKIGVLLQTTKNFLEGMLERGSGHIVTVASCAGLIGTYLCTDYSATKFAAVGFHESLLTELRAHGHRGVRTTVVCPYFVDTGMFAGVRPRLLPMLEPKFVAQRIVRALQHEEATVILPKSLGFFLPFKYWLPTDLCWDIMYRVLQGPQAMATFRGSHQPPAA